MKSGPLFAAALGVVFYLFGKLVLLPTWGVPIRFGSSADLMFLAFIVICAIADLIMRPKRRR
jgi:hypothetical protein